MVKVSFHFKANSKSKRRGRGEPEAAQRSW